MRTKTRNGASIRASGNAKTKKSGKKTRKVSHFDWSIGSSFFSYLIALFLSAFYAFGPLTAGFHNHLQDHTHQGHAEVVKLKNPLLSKDEELFQIVHV